MPDLPVPPKILICKVVVIPRDNQQCARIVTAENDTVTVAAETETVTVGEESETITVKSESDTLTVPKDKTC